MINGVPVKGLQALILLKGLWFPKTAQLGLPGIQIFGCGDASNATASLGQPLHFYMPPTAAHKVGYRTKMRHILFLILLSASSLAESRISALAKDLASKVVSTKRDFYVYHYERRDPNDAKFREHLSSWVDYYWDLSQIHTGSQEIRGFYAAIDPIVSWDWAGGEDAFLLYRVNLPRGLTTLDLYKHSEISPSAWRELAEAGCEINDGSSYNVLFMGNLSLACRNISLRILREFDVDLIRYPFNDSRLADCKADGDLDTSAFIIIRSKKITRDNLRVFTHLASEDEDGGIERSILKTISAESGNPYFPGSATSRRDLVTQYKETNLLNCSRGAQHN